MKKVIQNLLERGSMFDQYSEIIKPLDCELCQVFERRDKISGRIDCYCRLPIEVVVGVPASIGEKGIMLSIFYETYPAPKEFYNDTIGELKDYIRQENFLVAGIYCPGAMDEERVRIIKKILRNNKLLKIVDEKSI